MSIDPSKLKTIAHLARLEISKEEEQSVIRGFNEVLNMIERVKKVDTQSLLPMAHPHDLKQKLRPDVNEPIMDHLKITQLAPNYKDGLYLVPKVIE